MSNEVIADELFKKCKFILGDRELDYNDDDKNKDALDHITNMWSVYLGKTLTRSDVCYMLFLLKVARELIHHKEDNIIDAINYLVLYQNEKDNEDIQ